MSYEIPQQLEYQEKVVFGLTFSQLAWAMLFGSQQGGTGYYFKGDIDEAAVYNRSLTMDEISEHYNKTIQGNSYCSAYKIGNFRQ
ncbi:MAG: hypothetical protein Q8N77_05230 [Nanoarchaeota archaeon]|nr:hypothetical protein [Nanoarchaeota archaeon]